MKVQLFTVILKSEKNGHQSSTWDPFLFDRNRVYKIFEKKGKLTCIVFCLVSRPLTSLSMNDHEWELTVISWVWV